MKKLGGILKNKEIMNRIMFTILILFIFRIGAQITVPGVTLGEDMQSYLDSSYALSLMNLLGGGTLQSFSIFALGVSPYITAQIIVELLSKEYNGLKVLGGGKLEKKLTVQAKAFSKSAEAAITAAGGKIEVI